MKHLEALLRQKTVSGLRECTNAVFEEFDKLFDANMQAIVKKHNELVAVTGELSDHHNKLIDIVEKAFTKVYERLDQLSSIMASALKLEHDALTDVNARLLKLEGSQK